MRHEHGWNVQRLTGTINTADRDTDDKNTADRDTHDKNTADTSAGDKVQLTKTSLSYEHDYLTKNLRPKTANRPNS